MRSFVVAVAAVLCVGPAWALVGDSTGANAAPTGSAATPALGLIKVPDAAGGLSGVSCYNETSCIAVGTKNDEGFVVSIVDGVAGAIKFVPGTLGLTSVSCPSATNCWAAGTAPWHVKKSPGGTAGAIVPIYDGVPEGISGLVVGNGMVYTPDSASLYGISCSSTAFCMAAGNDFFMGGIVAPITNGSTGSPTSVSPQSMSGIECGLENWCIADGQDYYSGDAVFFKGSNLKFFNYETDSSIAELVAGACQERSISLTCITAGTAAAGGGVIYPIIDQTAGTVQDIAGTYDLKGVACGGTNYCVAVGQSSSAEGALVEIQGETPQAPLAVSGTTEFTSVSCASAKFCMAVGSNSSSRGVAYTFSLRS